MGISTNTLFTLSYTPVMNRVLYKDSALMLKRMTNTLQHQLIHIDSLIPSKIAIWPINCNSLLTKLLTGLPKSRKPDLNSDFPVQSILE